MGAARDRIERLLAGFAVNNGNVGALVEEYGNRASAAFWLEQEADSIVYLVEANAAGGIEREHILYEDGEVQVLS